MLRHRKSSQEELFRYLLEFGKRIRLHIELLPRHNALTHSTASLANLNAARADKCVYKLQRALNSPWTTSGLNLIVSAWGGIIELWAKMHFI